MKVFFSWSGPTSENVAVALSKWLPHILQPVRPWLSNQIDVGDDWEQKLVDELKEADFGIICLTNSNIWKPWLNFESGFLVGRFGGEKWRGSVAPFLFNVDTADLKGPLSAYQCASYSHDGVLQLIQSINERLGPDARIDDAIVRATFETCWKDMKGELDRVSSNSQETQTPFPWLYTFADLLRDEEKAEIKAIWIITDDLIKHATRYALLPRLIENLNKGITYRFYIPQATTVPTALANLKASSKPDLLECRCFNRGEFNGQAATDYIIIDSDDEPQKAFFRLPVDFPKELWVKVDEESATKLRQRFDEFWTKGQDLGRCATA